MALLDDILRLLGTNRTRMEWKVRAWKRGWERRKASLANRRAALTYEHKVCPQCGHPAGADETICTRCDTHMGGRTAHRARRLVGMVWSPDLPMVTSLIALACITTYAIVLFWQRQVGLVAGPSLSPHNLALFRFGSEFSPSILDGGQWWRAITAAFLHGGLLHIAMNMWSLWTVGAYLEETLGKAKTLALYLFLMLTASAFSLWWHTHDGGIGNSVGASGAICGLIGVAIGFSVRRRNVARHMQGRYLGWAVWIVLLGFSGWNIDNAGHVGGLVPGFLLGLVVRRRRDTSHAFHRMWVAAALAGVALTILAFVLMAQAPLPAQDLVTPDDTAESDPVDSVTRAAVAEAQNTFERDDDYMGHSHEVRYAYARKDSDLDGELEGRMRALFGEPVKATWKLRDRATGTQLRIFEGDDTWHVDGEASDAVVAHLTALLQRVKPADFRLAWYDPGHATDMSMHDGVLTERVLGYDETLKMLDGDLERAAPGYERARALNNSIRFYLGTTGHEADKPRFVANFRELQKLAADLQEDRYLKKLDGYAQQLGVH